MVHSLQVSELGTESADGLVLVLRLVYIVFLTLQGASYSRLFLQMCLSFITQQ